MVVLTTPKDWIYFAIGWAFFTFISCQFVADRDREVVNPPQMLGVAIIGAITAGTIYFSEWTGIPADELLTEPTHYLHITVALIVLGFVSSIILFPLIPAVGSLFGLFYHAIDPDTGQPIIITAWDFPILLGGWVGGMICVIFTWILGGPLSFLGGLGYAVYLAVLSHIFSNVLLLLRKLEDFIGIIRFLRHLF